MIYRPFCGPSGSGWRMAADGWRGEGGYRGIGNPSSPERRPRPLTGWERGEWAHGWCHGRNSLTVVRFDTNVSCTPPYIRPTQPPTPATLAHVSPSASSLFGGPLPPSALAIHIRFDTRKHCFDVNGRCACDQARIAHKHRPLSLTSTPRA
jgi:hypothetical protein